MNEELVANYGWNEGESLKKSVRVRKRKLREAEAKLAEYYKKQREGEN
tara:strand:+ start:486 stop:629 length:144 start_codon:yes stop_codon:yes gene_type:complete